MTTTLTAFVTLPTAKQIFRAVNFDGDDKVRLSYKGSLVEIERDLFENVMTMSTVAADGEVYVDSGIATAIFDDDLNRDAQIDQALEVIADDLVAFWTAP